MIQPSALNFLIVAAFVIIFGFLWRALAARYSDTAFGQAAAVIY